MAAKSRTYTQMVPALDGIRPLTKDDTTSQLKITIQKAYNGGGVEARVMIGGIDKTDNVSFFTFAIHADFNATPEFWPSKRVTQKKIDQCYDEFVTESNIEHMLQLAKAHYAERLQRKIDRDGYVPTSDQLEFFAKVA